MRLQLRGAELSPCQTLALKSGFGGILTLFSAVHLCVLHNSHSLIDPHAEKS